MEAGPDERPGDVLLRKVREAFAVVDEIYQHVIHPRDAAVPGTAFELKPAPTLLPDAGRQSFDSLLSFLDVQAPEVARIVREADLPERARRNTIRLLTAMASSPERFAPARAKPASLRRAIEVTAASAYLTELLVHHPEDMEILDSVDLPSPDGDAAGQLDMGLESFLHRRRLSVGVGGRTRPARKNGGLAASIPRPATGVGGCGLGAWRLRLPDAETLDGQRRALYCQRPGDCA